MENEEIKKEGKTYSGDKTFGLRVINAIQLIGFIVTGLLFFAKEKVVEGITYLLIGIVLVVFINGFANIIDLLDSINNKLDK